MFTVFTVFNLPYSPLLAEIVSRGKRSDLHGTTNVRHYDGADVSFRLFRVITSTMKLEERTGSVNTASVFCGNMVY